MITATASQGGPGTGVTLIVLGSLALTVGTVVAVYGVLDSECPFGCPPGVTKGLWVVVGGAASAITGFAALFGGLLLVKGSDDTDAKQTVSESLTPKMPDHVDSAWLRAPVWHDSVKDATTGAAKVGIPIYARSF